MVAIIPPVWYSLDILVNTMFIVNYHARLSELFCGIEEFASRPQHFKPQRLVYVP